jgi:hypothetical protein
MIYVRAPQWKVFRCYQRFRVLVAGRRFGKTQLALVELCQAAWDKRRLAWYVAPTYRQAKRVAWNRLKQMTRPYWAGRPRETDLTIELGCGGTISLRGADHYDALRGEGLDFVVLDEYASMRPQAWTEVLRPMLADHNGRALFIGTPRGFNHFYDLYRKAENQPDWGVFRYTTEEGGNVTPEELLAAAREMDQRSYRQEFQATFETLGTGRVYYAFEREGNVQPLRFNPRLPLLWTLDFNVNPMCSLLVQRDGEDVLVLEELVLPDSNTFRACDEFNARLRKLPSETPRPLNLYVYGDSTGQDRSTVASRTDWQIVREFCGRYADTFRTSFRVPSANPLVRDRVKHGERQTPELFGGAASVCRSELQDADRGSGTGGVEAGSPRQHPDGPG